MTNGDNGTQDPTFRITTGLVYSAVQTLNSEVNALRTEQALLNQSVSNMLIAMQQQQTRIEKLEGRFNSVLVGIGVGIATALIAVFRGVIT